MSNQPDVISALIAAGDEVDALVANLDDDQWALPTPAERWTIAHQIAHLAATFKLAGLAAGKPEVFKAVLSSMTGSFDDSVEATLAEYLAEPPAVLLSRWQAERATAEKALAAVPDGELVPWLVRPIPAPILAAAGMTELFGHGQDIIDALGLERVATDLIRPIVAFGVRTWDFGYLSRNQQAPDVEFRFELTAPSGALWEFGPQDAEQRITGSALDFCLLVTRRRHRDDLDLRAVGADADGWLNIAQAYRGPAGPGRRPGQFAK